jgi:serine/threonine protein kinase/protein-disulfide isomerase
VALNVGDTVAGRYLLVERLGAGGMGIVYRAQDTTLDRDVALKVLLPHVSTDEALLQRFRREARVLAKLRNPGIIVVHDLVIAEDGSIALILEYVGGGSLDDRIAGGPLPWRAAAQIGVAAAEALAEAHDAGIVHRDIKPSNILLEPDGGVRVADFGIAQVSGEVSMTMQGEAIGTPAYMSPEQAAGSDVGPASDIYSLGAVLFAASTGSIPFPTEEGGFAAALAHITQPVPDPRTTAPGVPDAAAAIIMRAMQKEPGARFGSARELAAALRASADLTTGDIPVAMPASMPSDGPPTVDPAAAQPPPAVPPPPPAADATQLGSTPPTPPPPAAPPAPSQYAAAPMPPAPPVYVPAAAAMPAGGSAPGRSMNTLVLIGAAVVLGVVAVIVVVTLVMTGGSDEGPAATAATPVPAPATPSPTVNSEASPTSPDSLAVPPGTGMSGGFPIGDEGAADYVEVYLDYQCPGCQQWERDIGNTLLARALQPGSGLQISPHVMAFIGETSSDLNPPGASALAAAAAGCVFGIEGAQRFAAFHDALFAGWASTDPEERYDSSSLVTLASGQGMSDETLACIQDGRYIPFVAFNTSDFIDRGVTSTPTVVVNGRVVEDPFGDPELLALLGR